MVSGKRKRCLDRKEEKPNLLSGSKIGGRARSGFGCRKIRNAVRQRRPEESNNLRCKA